MSEFVIRELEPLGGTPISTATSTGKGKPEVFRWNAKHHSIPLAPWSFGVHQRTARTDYPGADEPTEQILGPNFTPFTLSGVWDDRYNIDYISRHELAKAGQSAATVYDTLGGFAVNTWKRFETMVRRGNPVRIEFEKIVIEGVITDASFEYFHRARIGYSFTLSPHHRTPGGFFRRRKTRGVLSASQLLTEAETEIDAMVAMQAIAPSTSLIGTIFLDAEGYVEDLQTAATAIDTAIAQRNLTPEVEPNASLLRIASQFYSMTTIAYNLILLLDGYDTSEALNYESGAGNLTFDTWSRGLMYYARRIVVAGRRAASELQQRAAPDAIALYTPTAGESLYRISNRFYKTPHQWRAIAERNGLSSFTLSGAETLIIPEATTR